MLKKCGFLLLLGALLGLSLAPLRAEEEGHKSGESSGKKDQKSGEEEGAKKAPDGISGGRFAGDPLYVHLAPMVLPIAVPRVKNPSATSSTQAPRPTSRPFPPSTIS